jgi:Uma2 family endonuclease
MRATTVEFERLPDDGDLHELDGGELIVMPPQGLRHGIVQAAVLEELSRAADFGIVPGRCGFRLAPDVVQAPDVAFIRGERTAEIAWVSPPAPVSYGYWIPIRSPSTYTRSQTCSEL